MGGFSSAEGEAEAQNACASVVGPGLRPGTMVLAPVLCSHCRAICSLEPVFLSLLGQRVLSFP